MSIYGKESYSQSKCVFLAGPIEYWWQDDNFDTPLAVAYRRYRELLAQAFVDEGFLVFLPHQAFKGSWNEKMQEVNNCALIRSDVVIDMSPRGIPGLGTAHEMQIARDHGIPIVCAFPDVEWPSQFGMQRYAETVVRVVTGHLDRYPNGLVD